MKWGAMSAKLSSPSRLRDDLSTLVSLFISIAFIPLGLSVLAWSSLTRAAHHHDIARRRVASQPGLKPRVVLVTGVGSTTGLALARSLFEAGHTVIGADFADTGNRLSKAIQSFYTLPTPSKRDGLAYYAQELIRIIGREDVDLWISCSRNVKQDAEARKVVAITSSRKCRLLQFDSETIDLLSNKDSFLDFLRSVDLPTPETHRVSTRASVHRILNASNGTSRTYCLKKASGALVPADTTLLPRRTLSQTYQHVSQIPVSQEAPFLLEEVITGEQYHTQALVMHSEIRAFAASPISDDPYAVESIPGTSAVSQAMLRYTHLLISRTNRDLSGFLGLAFTVKKRVTEKGVEKSLYATECRLCPDTPGIPLFAAGASFGQLVLEGLPTGQVNGVSFAESHAGSVLLPLPGSHYHATRHDFWTLVLLPLLSLLKLHMGVRAFLLSLLAFAQRLILWKDALFEWWDPMPWWWAYQVEWPAKLAHGVCHGHVWKLYNSRYVTMQ